MQCLMSPRTPNDFHWAPYHVLAMAMHASAHQIRLENLFDSRKRETTSLVKAAEKYVAAWWWRMSALHAFGLRVAELLEEEAV
eukprot:symbB.v1.2.033757.t1/scaffold4238.1/size42579/1